MRRISRRSFLAIFPGAAPFLALSGRRVLTDREGPAAPYPSYLRLQTSGELNARAGQLLEIYESCTLCPRDCRVNRKKNEKGKCRATAVVKVSSAFPHFGEEAPLVGKKGSGTIFFSNCGLRCLYCQNYAISIDGEGVEISDEQLGRIMVRVQEMGCHNINLVTPTHYVPNIVNALRTAIPLGLKVPLVYNSGGYEKLETLKLLDGIVDIYMPDGKYMDPENAGKYSSEAYSYPFYVKIALKEMFRQVGDLAVERGVARRGLLIRHLILPNRIAGTEEFLKFVAQNISRTTYINLMRQYRPEYKAFDFPELSRRITSDEYAEALRLAQKYGLTRLD